MRPLNRAVAAKARKLSIPYEDLKNQVLKKDYELSFVFIDDKESKRLNSIYRKKNKPTNVLSFPLSKSSGEIFIDLMTSEKEAKDFNMPFEKFVKLLFIHGLLHLKGLSHGARMERAEAKLLKQFDLQ